jgi:serine/threonine protein phosphatase PrpC
LATAVVRYTAAAITDRGRKRTSNEDAFGYSVEHGVYLVCDGMGGAAAGEIASSLAVEEALKLLTGRIDTMFHAAASQSAANSLEKIEANGHSPLPRLAEEAVFAANEAIHSRSQRNTRLSGMGTTLVGILAGPPEAVESDGKLWILNVGDSRCYRLRDGQIELCTEDHSLVEEQVRMGRMTRSEAARSPLRNVITRALGTQGSVTPDVIEAGVEPGDLYLLCSDGLTRELTDEAIETILNTTVGGLNPRPASLELLCESLVLAANKAGGNDNITCLIVRVE